MAKLHYPILEILSGAVAALVVATLVAGGIARFGFPLPPAERRIGCIDGLRGYLALSVMVHHFIVWLQVTRMGEAWIAPSINLFNQFGAGGVCLFFMTTGLVFYPRILRGFEACNWRAIYTSRVFRIIPLVSFSVVLIIGVIILRTGAHLNLGVIKPALIWIFAITELPLLDYGDARYMNANVLWSLRYEWLFYLLLLPTCAFAMDVVRGRGRPSWVVPAGLFVVGALGTVLVFGTQARNLSDAPTMKLLELFIYLPSFAVGMLAYEIQNRPALAQRLRHRIVSVIAVASLATGMTMFSHPHFFGLPLFAVFFISVACGNDLGGLLRTRGALMLGECSFGIYLLHGLALNILYVDLTSVTDRFPTQQLPVLLPAAAIVVVVFTATTFMLVERPAIKLGARISKYWK